MFHEFPQEILLEMVAIAVVNSCPIVVFMLFYPSLAAWFLYGHDEGSLVAGPLSVEQRSILWAVVHGDLW